MCLKHWNIGSSRYCNLIHTEGILKPEFTYIEIWFTWRVHWNPIHVEGILKYEFRVYWNLTEGILKKYEFRVYWNLTEGILKYEFRVHWNLTEGILKYESSRVYWNMNSSCIEGSWIATRIYWNHKNLQNIEKNVKKILAGGYTEIPKLSSMSCQVHQPHACNVDFQFPMP